MRLFFLALFFLSGNVQGSNEMKCLGWFLKSGVLPDDPGCSLKCSITPVDMATFECPSSCSDLCSKSIADHILVYSPRLTEGDKIVISRMPFEALSVFLIKQRVEHLSEKIFKNPGREDESDAFRHFVWSVLLAQELGVSKAKVFLDAHEQDKTQTDAERRMDLANNEAGIKYFEATSSDSVRIEIDRAEGEALRRLRQKALVVNRPKLKQIPGGYYSK